MESIMKKNELRIGNYVFHKEDNVKEVSVVSGVFELAYVKFENADWIYDINPIPLTEEWLRNFDIKKIWLFEIHGCDSDGFYISYVYDSIHLKYVHQLQNLYFALTGEELCLQY